MTTESICATLDSLTASELHLKWQRNAITKTYHLYFERLGVGRENKLSKIWKMPDQKGYGLLSGCTCTRLNDAKAIALVTVKKEIKEALFRVHEALCNNEQITLSLFHHEAIHTILNRWLKETLAQTLEQHLAPIAVIRIRAENNRYGNAVAAFDTAGNMFSLLKFGIHYRWQRENQREVNLKTLALNFVCDRYLGGRNHQFGEQGYLTIPLVNLSDCSLDEGLTIGFEHIKNFVHSDRNHYTKIDKSICTTASYRQPY